LGCTWKQMRGFEPPNPCWNDIMTSWHNAPELVGRQAGVAAAQTTAEYAAFSLIPSPADVSPPPPTALPRDLSQNSLDTATHSAVWCTSRYPGKLLSTWRMTFSLSLTADDVGCDLPVTEPVSFHGPITVSATEASLLLDPEYGMLYLQNSDMTSALDSLGTNWSRVCLSRALNHGALWHIVFLRLRNILTYLQVENCMIMGTAGTPQ